MRYAKLTVTPDDPASAQLLVPCLLVKLNAASSTGLCLHHGTASGQIHRTAIAVVFQSEKLSTGVGTFHPCLLYNLSLASTGISTALCTCALWT